MRWTSALALSCEPPFMSWGDLERRVEESHDVIERCAMLAAVIYSGDVTSLHRLHECLQEASLLPSLRPIWRTAIVGAFRDQPSFDKRAFELWCVAARLNERTLLFSNLACPEMEQTKPRCIRILLRLVNEQLGERNLCFLYLKRLSLQGSRAARFPSSTSFTRSFPDIKLEVRVRILRRRRVLRF